MSGQHCENYDVKRETVHFTREMLTAAAGISARYSKFAFDLFCYITNHLMTGPLGNSEFCFPRISMFPSTSSRETLRFSGNKIHCSPRDQSLSVYCSPSGPVIKCLMFPARDTVDGKQLCDLEVVIESARCWPNIVNRQKNKYITLKTTFVIMVCRN